MGSLQEDSLGKEVDELLTEPCIVKKKVRQWMAGWVGKEGGLGQREGCRGRGKA